MGLSIDVSNLSNDYSYLFSSTSSSSGNWLADYMSIKNGSYSKLMKAYYAESKASSSSTTSTGTSGVLEKILEEKKNPKVSEEAQEANANLTSGLSTLKTTLSVLQNDSTYTDTNGGKTATDKVVTAVKAYVEDYNNVVTAAKDSTLTNKTAYVANMMGTTATNADKLAEIGITVKSNGTISLDEAKLKAAGVSKVQELFSANDIMSYGSTVASRVQYANISSGTSSTDTDSTDTSNTAGSSAAALEADSKALASDELYAMLKDEDGNETGKYDIEKILGTAKSFVENYNNMFAAAESSSNSGVLANLSYIREKTAYNADALEKFGISVDAKGKMSINEDTFKNADMSKVQDFFKDYGSSIAVNASLVDYYTTTQASASSGYTADGTYNVQGSSRYTDVV